MILPHFLFTLSSTPEQRNILHTTGGKILIWLIDCCPATLPCSPNPSPLSLCSFTSAQRDAKKKRFCESLPPRPLELRTWILSLFPWSRAFLMHSASLRLFVPTPVSQQAGEVYLRCTGINDYLASLCERSSNTVTDLQKRIHLCKTSLTWTLEV